MVQNQCDMGFVTPNSHRLILFPLGTFVIVTYLRVHKRFRFYKDSRHYSTNPFLLQFASFQGMLMSITDRHQVLWNHQMLLVFGICALSGVIGLIYCTEVSIQPEFSINL